MKKLRIIIAGFVVSMNILFLLTGCELFEANSGKLVRFSGESSAPATKAGYGQENNNSGHQMIVWNPGDQIKIVSDLAQTTEEHGSSHSHEYTLSDASGIWNDKTSSYAKFSLNEYDEGGLRWANTTDYHQFWAVYPKTVSLTYEKREDKDVGIVTASANNLSEFLMLAYRRTQYIDNKGDVFLQFYPAFTALQFNIDCNADRVSITKCEIESSSQMIDGGFTATIVNISDNGIEFGSFEETNPSDKMILDSGKDIGFSGKSFTFFCLPKDLKDITITCYFTLAEKEGEFHKKMNISAALNEAYQLECFSACKKYVIDLTLDSNVEDPDDPEDFDLSFKCVETMGQIIGGTINQWTQEW